MKLAISLFAVVGVLAGNSATAAISCSSDATLPASTATPYGAAQLTTCGKNTTMGVGLSTIGGASGVGGWQQGANPGIGIIGLTLGANNSGVTISVASGSAFIPEVLVGGPNATCTDGVTYVNDNTGNTVGSASGNVTIPNGSAAGTYWIFVGDVTGGAGDGGCGTYTLNISGTLPVKLQKFSVN